MLAQILAPYIDESVEEVQRLLKMTGQEVFMDPLFQEHLAGLDVGLLQNTLVDARHAYSDGLPALKSAIVQRYDYTTDPVTPFALANWLVGFLKQPDQLMPLIEWHHRVPLEVVRTGLPMLLEMLEMMSEGKVEWQHAVAIVGLTLVASR